MHTHIFITIILIIIIMIMIGQVVTFYRSRSTFDFPQLNCRSLSGASGMTSEKCCD